MLDALPVILANVVTLGLAVIPVLKWRYGRDLRQVYGAGKRRSIGRSQ
jgi:hypothetical protein